MASNETNPDGLLKDINKSILAKAIVIALVAHAIVVFGTSFSLYRDWAQYGVKSPSAIKNQKKEERLAAEKAARDEEIKRKADEAAALSSNAVPAKASAPAAAKPAEAADGAKGASGQVKPPEIQPLDRPSTDDLSLDDIGL